MIWMQNVFVIWPRSFFLPQGNAKIYMQNKRN